MKKENKIKKLIFNIMVVAVIFAAGTWVITKFFHFGNVEFTDNAQVKQHIFPVNTRVQGYIKEIRFDDFSEIKTGDTLAVIEDIEYRLRLAQAEADYQNVVAGLTAMEISINTAQNNISVSDAGISELKILMENSEREYNRYEKLFEKGAVTKQEFEAVETIYKANKAKYKSLNLQKQSTSLTKEEQTQRLQQNEAAIKLAEAALELARLNLSYTIITAPCDGIAGRKNIQEGQLVQPGQTLVNLVSSENKWVIANYKETQTKHISEGQYVEIKVDAVPDVVYIGYVGAVSSATGASFSVIPQDNSAGNFIKVEQRIPVRIELNGENKPEDLARLRSGMNVECKVKY